MKIAIPASAPSLDAPMDSRFGRSAYFIIVDTDTMQWEAHENPAVRAGGGAGLQAVQFLSRFGTQAVIGSDFGPNATMALSAAGILMYQCNSPLTVREAVSQFSAGQLQQVDKATNPGHYGK